VSEDNTYSNIDTKQMLLLAVLISGSVIGILCFFMEWFGFDLFPWHYTYTGYEMVTRDLIYLEKSYHFMMPAIALVFAVIALVASGVAIRGSKKIGGAVAAISGVGMTIAAIIYTTGPEVIFNMGHGNGIYVTTLKLGDHSGIGVYLTMVVGILLVISGIIMVYLETREPKIE
jgi:hypothetical protein